MLIIWVVLVFLTISVNICDSKGRSILCNEKKSLVSEKIDPKLQFCDAIEDTEVDAILDRIDGHLLDIKQIIQMHQHIPMDLLRKVDTELNRLKSIQGDPFAEEPKFNRIEKSQLFMQWCTQHGIYHDGLEIREHVQGFGLSLFATKELYPQDIVMKIPKHTLITYASTVADVGHLIPNEFKEDDQLYIMLKVLIERLKPTPRWGPYIDLLPRNFSSHPVCFPLEDQSMLQGSPTYFRVLENSITKLTNYAVLYRHFRDNPILLANTSLKLDTFTFNAYEWAVMVPMTRAYWTNTHGAAVIPLFDMQNHASTKEATETIDGNDSIILIMERKLKTGEELLLQYDHNCRIGEFYSTWGFSCYDEQFLQFPAQLEQRLKLPLLKSDNTMTMKEQKRYLMIEWKRVWSKYIDFARNRLTRYEKSFDENTRMISNGRNFLAFGARANLLQVMHEQRILHRAIETVEAYLKWNASLIEQFAQQLLEKHPTKENLPDIETLFADLLQKVQRVYESIHQYIEKIVQTGKGRLSNLYSDAADQHYLNDIDTKLLKITLKR